MEEGPHYKSALEKSQKKNRRRSVKLSRTSTREAHSFSAEKIPPLVFSKEAEEALHSQPIHSARPNSSKRSSVLLSASNSSKKTPRPIQPSPEEFLSEQANISQRLFQQIHRDDFFKKTHHGAKEDMIAHWNDLTQRIIKDFAQSESTQHQQAHLNFYCDCLRSALHNHDYHSASAIYISLESHDVNKILKKTLSLNMHGACKSYSNKAGTISFRKNDKSLFAHALTLFKPQDNFLAYVEHMSILEHAIAIKSKQKNTCSFSSFYNDFHKSLSPLLSLEAPQVVIPWIAPYNQKADLINQIGTKEEIDRLRKEEGIIRFMMGLNCFRKSEALIQKQELITDKTPELDLLSNEFEWAQCAASSEDDSSTLSIEISKLTLEHQDDLLSNHATPNEARPVIPHTPSTKVLRGLEPEKKTDHKKKHLI